MIRIRVYKLKQVILSAVIALLVIAAIIAGLCAVMRSDAPRAQETLSYSASVSADAADADKSSRSLSALPLALQQDPLRLIRAQLPVDPQAIPVTAQEESADKPDEPDRIRVEIARIEGSYSPTLTADLPRVLIYHTHSYEAFAQDPDHPYEETSQWRTKDPNCNIMGVGSRLTQELEALGIEVVHDMTEHEPPRLGTAYVRSLATLQAYADAGEEFDLMIDLHRDAASSRNTNPSCVVSDGTRYARLMMLIGTGEGSEGNHFSIRPNWQENYKLAQALTDALNAQIPDLCRDVMVKTGRYNQHMSTSAVLIEVGHNENTLAEALNATQPLARAIAEILFNDK